MDFPDNVNIAAFKDFFISYRENNIVESLSLEHYHDGYEIDFFIKANIQIFVKDAKYDIIDNDALFISEYDVHKIVYVPDSFYSRYVINFRKQFITDLLNVLDLKNLLERLDSKQHKKPDMSLSQKNELEILFNKLFRLYVKYERRRSTDTEALIKSYLVILLIHFNEMLGNNIISPKLGKKDTQVKAIIQFIDENFMENINLDLLEDNFYLSKYYISRIFKEITGFSVVEYIQHRRIIEAQKMLRFSKRDVTNVAYDCGFNNIQHFYRVFKKITKTTPYLYRKYS